MGKLLDTREVAERLGVSPRTLDFWRYQRKGPPYKKLGQATNAAVRYDEDELRAWVEGTEVNPERDEATEAS